MNRITLGQAAKQALRQAQTRRLDTAADTVLQAVHTHGARALRHVIAAWLDTLLDKIDAPERLPCDGSPEQKWAADLYAARRRGDNDVYEQILTSPSGPDQVRDCVLAVVQLVADAHNSTRYS